MAAAPAGSRGGMEARLAELMKKRDVVKLPRHRAGTPAPGGPGAPEAAGAGQQQWREERDTMGPMRVPADRYWGAQTQRSLENFKIGGERIPPQLIRALAIVKISW